MDWSAFAVTSTTRWNWVNRPLPGLNVQTALTGLLQTQAPFVLPFLIGMVACTTSPAWFWLV